MKDNDVTQMIKNTALNKIRKIYNPKYDFPYEDSSYYVTYEDEYEGKSKSEQREISIMRIIEDMEKELKNLKDKKNDKIPLDR